MQGLAFDSIQWPALFANLVIGPLNLLIPQSDIYSLEPAMDMRLGGSVAGSVGGLEQSRQTWPLFALDSELDVLPEWPEHYRIALLFKNVRPVYGLLCEQVYSMERRDFSIVPVPEAMRSAGSPLLALALCGNEVRCLSSASALAALLPEMAKN